MQSAFFRSEQAALKWAAFPTETKNRPQTRKEFSEYTGIPVRTLEDWEAGRRTPPEYIPRLLAYQIKFDEMMRGKKN